MNLLWIALACLVSPAPAQDAGVLDSVSSEHFVVYHESFYPPAGVLAQLEGLHERLLLNLISFAPWAKEARIEVYIYKDSESYHDHTGAKEWSGGYVQYAQRRIFTYEGDRLPRTLAHEMAHLFFDDFFISGSTATANLRHPPTWLTEGVATLMEWDYGPYERPPDLSRLKARPQSLESFLTFDYHDEVHQGAEVSDWYLQAYSLAGFLMRDFSLDQFFVFCRGLRDGSPLDRALASAYGTRIPNARALEELWKERLREKAR